VAAAIRGPGSLIIHGRLDGAIHSGGETVFPEQVRQLLLARIQQAQLPVAQLLLLGAPDLEWGEQLVALVRPQPPDRPSHCAPGEDVEPQAAPSQLLERLADLARSLAPPLRPRRWLLCPELETNATGKWERRRWQAWLERAAPDAPGPRPEERADQDPQNPGAAQSPSDVPPQAPRRRNS
jgi:O-succinylbenzoic acid--CoA ligase